MPWQQIVDLTYKPKYELLKHDEAVSDCFIVVFLELSSNKLYLFDYCLFPYYAAPSLGEAFFRFKKKVWVCVGY